jgi:predicted SAM-dependent methyltransferase
MNASYMVKKIIKNYTSTSFRRVIKQVKAELGIARMHKEGLKRAKKYQNSHGLKLHAGCGDTIKPGFVNVDLNRSADIPLDLREPLPFSDASFALVYSEHFVEHLEYPTEAQQFFAESFRVLEPGGVFSVGVPDIEWPIEAYANDPKFNGWFEYVRTAYPESDFLKTRAELVNYSFRQGTEHKFAWDFETMKHALQRVGFTNVKRREFDPALDSEKSRYSLPDDPSRCTTLYVVASRP